MWSQASWTGPTRCAPLPLPQHGLPSRRTCLCCNNGGPAQPLHASRAPPPSRHLQPPRGPLNGRYNPFAAAAQASSPVARAVVAVSAQARPAQLKPAQLLMLTWPLLRPPARPPPTPALLASSASTPDPGSRCTSLAAGLQGRHSAAVAANGTVAVPAPAPGARAPSLDVPAAQADSGSSQVRSDLLPGPDPLPPHLLVGLHLACCPPPDSACPPGHCSCMPSTPACSPDCDLAGCLLLGGCRRAWPRASPCCPCSASSSTRCRHPACRP